MKRIILLYLGGLLLCAFLGGVVSLAYHYSWYFLILLAIPISFGWVILSDLFLRINDDNLKAVSILTVLSFVAMLGLLLIAGYYQLDETSFWGLSYAAAVSSYILGLAVVGLGFPKRWEEKRKNEKKFPYWKLKSASYWCRFFCFFCDGLFS